MSNSLWPHELKHARPPCPSPTPGVYSNSCPLSQWCHPTISSSVIPFSSRLQSFPTSGSFQMSQFFTSGGQSIGISALASVLPMNIQDWFPLGNPNLISLKSKGLSRVFSNTTVQKHQLFGTQLSLCPTLTFIDDYWKNHSFDQTDLCFLICYLMLVTLYMCVYNSLSLFTFMHWRRKWQPTPVFLPGESQGWGRTESDMTEVT